ARGLLKGARNGATGFLFPGVKLRLLLSEGSFEPAIGIDAGDHFAVLAEALRGGFCAALGAGLLGFVRPKLLGGGPGGGPGLARVSEVLPELFNGRRFGQFAQTAALLA